MSGFSLKGLIAIALVAPVSSSADSTNLDWCKKAAKDFVDTVYKQDEDGILDNGRVESEILDKFVKEEQVTGRSTPTDKMMNRALYLRSRTSTPKSEAVIDVYSLCASLTSGDGRGRSSVSYGEDVGQSFADKEAAWEAYFRPNPRCVDSPDWEISVECGNERMRARAEFDRKWSRGELGPKRR